MSDIRKSIVWADWSWNPVWGCLNKCPYCYAQSISKRFGKQICGRDDFQPTWIEKNFQKPIPKNANHIFVNSMSDVAFWKLDWLEKVVEKIIYEYSDKTFLFLTKDLISAYELWGLMDDGLIISSNDANICFGATINYQSDLVKIATQEADFLSIEPIFERIDLSILKMKYLHQVIVGAETGNRKEKVIPKAEWIEEIREFCQKNGIKLFEKDSLKDIVKRPLIQERI